MKAIKNFNAFKKSLLSATNGNMVESLDSSNQFGGCEYQSYRVYVDDVYYYNMFVIYNFATNTYDVSLETSTCTVSTMSRVCKTQKAMIDSVVRWCYYSYLNIKEKSVDSEEYTDRCTESEKTETNKIKGHIYIDTDSVKVAPLPEQQTSEESIKDTIISDDNIAYQTAEVTKTKHSVLEVMQCMMCYADREGNRCGGKQWCKQTWKRYDAIVNPEWHHVSLATLANIDFDMLDEKRKLVFDINQILKDGIRNLYKCENHISFEVLERYVIRKCDELIRHNRLKAFWFSYIARQLDEVRRNTIYLYTPYITAHRNRW